MARLQVYCRYFRLTTPLSLKRLHLEIDDAASQHRIGALKREAEGADDVESIIFVEITVVGAERLDKATVDIEARFAVGSLDGDVLTGARVQRMAEAEVYGLRRCRLDHIR